MGDSRQISLVVTVSDELLGMDPMLLIFFVFFTVMNSSLLHVSLVTYESLR